MIDRPLLATQSMLKLTWYLKFQCTRSFNVRIRRSASTVFHTGGRPVSPARPVPLKVHNLVPCCLQSLASPSGAVVLIFCIRVQSPAAGSRLFPSWSPWTQQCAVYPQFRILPVARKPMGISAIPTCGMRTTCQGL